MRRSVAVGVVVGFVVAYVLSMAIPALASISCRVEYTVWPGGSSCTEICDWYDDYSGKKMGTLRQQCPG